MSDKTNRVRYLRAVRFGGEMSQKELAERAGIDPSTLSDIETQKTNFSAVTALAIARALGVTVEDLFLPPDTDEASVTSGVAAATRTSRGAIQAGEPPAEPTPEERAADEIPADAPERT